MAVNNIGQIGVFFKGTTPPTNTDLVWLDTSVSPAIFMVYDSTQSMWVTQGGGNGDVTAASTFGTDNSVILSDGTGKGVKAGTNISYASFVLTIAGNSTGIQMASDSTNNPQIRCTDNADKINLIGGATNGGQIELFGSANPSTPNETHFSTNSILSAIIDSSQNWDLQGNELTGVSLIEVGNIKAEGNTLSTEDTNGDLIIDVDGTGNILLESGTAIAVNTLDGSDDSSLRLSGGGAISGSRGAFITLAGNESGSTGDVDITAGSVSGEINFTTNSSVRATISNVGNWDFQGKQINNFAQKAGEIYFSTPIETVISTVNTPVKALGTTTAGTLDLFDENSVSNRLRYIGTDTEDFLVICSASITTASNSKVIGIYIAKNGVVQAGSEIIRLVSTGSDVGSMSCNILVSLEQNDYVELWVENQTDSTNLTIEKCSLSVK